MARATLELARGRSRDFAMTVNDPATQGPYAAGAAPFLPGDVIAAAVFAGDGQAVLLTPAAVWVAPADGTYLVSLNDSDTAGMGLGTYRLQVTLLRSGRTATLGDFNLRLTAAPGATGQLDAAGASIALAFTAYPDLRLWCPWLDDLQADTDSTGFQAEQVRATTQLIDLLVDLWKYRNAGLTLGLPGYGPASVVGAGDAPPSRYLYDQLVPLSPGAVPGPTYPDRLSTTPNLYRPTLSTALLLKDKVIEVCARRAAGFVCRAQVGRDSSRDWWAEARYQHAEADSLLRTLRAEVDLSVPQTGWASVTIHCGATSLR